MRYFDYYALKLVGIIIAVFILQLSFPSITDEFALISKDVISRPWILITSIFLHGGFSHIIYNMLVLGMIGSILEKIVGSKRFLMIFFATGIIASFGSMPFYEASLGASGAIMGLAGCLAILRPRMMVYIYGIVPMPMILLAGLLIVMDMAGIFHPGGIANAAHLAGMFSGIMFGFAWRGKFLERRQKRNILREEEINKWEDEYMR